jgi:hypothetical protein
MSKLTTIRRVVGKTTEYAFQGELVDTIEKPGAINVLAYLNRGDERFSKGSERRAWFPITLQTLEEEFHLPIVMIESIKALEIGQKFGLNLSNPKINGLKLRVQVNETIYPDTWQRQNAMKAAKQIMIDESVAKSRIKTSYDLALHIGKNGYFMDNGGNFIFQRSSVTVDGQVNHTFVDGTLVPETELANYGATLADNAEVESEVAKQF